MLYLQPMKTKKTQQVVLPREAFQRLVGVIQAADNARDSLEDFLTLSNPKIMGEVRRAQLDYKHGRVVSWTALKKRYGV